MEKFFGTDGIRGVVGEYPLVPDFILRLGQAAGIVLGQTTAETTIVIGRDTRRSGGMLQSALSAGLLASGVHVIDAGIIPTPGVAWLVRHLGVDAGVVISASHNPVEQNGVKFFNREGRKLAEEIETEIEGIARAGEDGGLIDTHSHLPLRKQIGRFMDGKFTHELYIQGLLSEQTGLHLDSLKIIVDCANGAASQFAPEVLGRLGGRVIAIHSSPTGLNINANAGSEHVRRWVGEMGALIQQYRADFGLAFDGDADRVVFVDEKGQLIDGDFVLGMLARYFDARGQLMARSVVTTTMRNGGLKSFLEAQDIRLYETAVGDKYVVEKLFALQKESTQPDGIGLGGEQSGHIVLIDDKHTTGDGIRTALFVMRAFLEAKQKSMSEFAATVGKTPQIIASAYVGHGKRLNKNELEVLRDKIQGEATGLAEINLRYSGTEPLFRMMLESDGSLNVKELGALAVKICRQIQSIAACEGKEIDVLNCTHGGVVTFE